MKGTAGLVICQPRVCLGGSKRISISKFWSVIEGRVFTRTQKAGHFRLLRDAPMGWYGNEENVLEYMSLAAEYDGAQLIKLLKPCLPESSSVLELGMGPGKDVKLLEDAAYVVCGSDLSDEFLKVYKEKKPDADVLVLDAISIATERRFDCIYSNKVLHHLTLEQLKASFKRQAEVLKGPGIALHSFWKGSHVEDIGMGTICQHHTEESLREAAKDWFDFLKIELYPEMESEDSIYVLMRKKVG